MGLCFTARRPWQTRFAKICIKGIGLLIPHMSVGMYIHPPKSHHCYHFLDSFWMTKGEKPWVIDFHSEYWSYSACSWKAWGLVVRLLAVVSEGESVEGIYCQNYELDVKRCQSLVCPCL